MSGRATRRGRLVLALLTLVALGAVDEITAQGVDLVAQGRAALEARKIDEAMDEAVEKFPDAFVVYLLRGVTAVNVPEIFHKGPMAVKDLGTVVAMRQANAQAVPQTVMPSVYLNLGLAHKRNRQPAEARAAWEKGRALYPSAPEAQAIERELRSL